jgi:hypothetical protein
MNFGHLVCFSLVKYYGTVTSLVLSDGCFMDGFPSIVRCQSTTYLCAGEDDSVARERNARRKREIERSDGLLLRPRILDPDFSHGYSRANSESKSSRIDSICRLLIFSVFKNILSIKYFGHLASPNCAIL